jgi:Na+-driven multidrug efflux pump
MLLVSVFASLFNSLIALVVVPVLLGDEYREIHGVVWIASLTIIPLFLGAVQEVWIAHQKTTSIVLKKVIVGLPLSFVLLYVFIATWGLKGAAFGMVVSYFVTAVVLNYFFVRNFLVLQLRGIGL